MNKFKIAILPGDGIGPEVMESAVSVLKAIEAKFGKQFELRYGLVGGAAYDKHGSHFPAETLELCKSSQAILFGSVGGPVSDQHLPKWKGCEANSILAIRKAFSFHANFRPAKVYPALAARCPLKNELVGKGVDLLIVRELLGDCYFGEHTTIGEAGNRIARDVSEYSESQIQAVARDAFLSARNRRKRVTSVDKANVLDTSKLWRAVVTEVGMEYPDVELSHMLVDNCAMQLILNPAQFDVVLCSNMFGDILSDCAAVLPGSLGLVPSASFNSDGFALYEPSGGSAPDIAGKGIANPVAQILSASMMLRYSFGLNDAADAIERGVDAAFAHGLRTQDIVEPGGIASTTAEFSSAVIEYL